MMPQIDVRGDNKFDDTINWNNVNREDLNWRITIRHNIYGLLHDNVWNVEKRRKKEKFKKNLGLQFEVL